MSQKLNKLREDLKQAISDRDEQKKSILKVVIAELERVNPTKLNDAACDSVIRKTYEGLTELKKLLPVGDSRISATDAEMKLLEPYMPRRLSKEEIRAELLKIRDSFVSLPDGQCMRIGMEHFKSLGINADGKLVKELIDEIRR